MFFLCVYGSMGLYVSHASWKSTKNDHLCVLKESWKFRIPIIYNFAVMYPWNVLFS